MKIPRLMNTKTKKSAIDESWYQTKLGGMNKAKKRERNAREIQMKRKRNAKEIEEKHRRNARETQQEKRP